MEHIRRELAGPGRELPRGAALLLAALADAIAPVFDLRQDCRPGDRCELILDPQRRVQELRLVSRRQPERPLLVRRQDGGLTASRLQLPLSRDTLVVDLEIEDNLAAAIARAGEQDALTDLLADDILGTVIDFRKDPRRGDRLGLVVEKLACDGQFVRYGDVLAAHYRGQRVNELAVRYVDSAGEPGYFDQTGKSLARQFVLYALPYRGITSGFSMHRLHPVLHRVTPHLGTDYAAAMGTQVWATASGVVTQAGVLGALGKAVVIQHANGYVTRYGHLSQILVARGQRVGATGRVTGPHLHYELIKDGRHLNPESINKGIRGEALAATALGAFQATRDQLLDLLREHRTPTATAWALDSSAPAGAPLTD